MKAALFYAPSLSDAHRSDRYREPHRPRGARQDGRERRLPQRPPFDRPRLGAYIELYYQGKLMLDEMITKRFRLEQVDEAFQAMREGEVIRSVLMFD